VTSTHDIKAADAAVIGGGPAGLVSAIALATAGVDTLIIAPSPQEDFRTTAFLAGSVTALSTLGVWDACRVQAAPLAAIRIIDDTRRLWRAPEVNFAATEIGLDTFGHNIENRYLVAALQDRAAKLNIPRISASALAVVPDHDGVTVKLAAGEAHVRLAIGADGQHSLCRAAAGISSHRHTYPQTALTLNLAHARPHHDTATEFHTETGPFTLVPLPGRRSSLVCVLDPERASHVAAMSDAELAIEIERRAHSLFGKMTVEPGRGMFPLAVETARSVAGNRIALVGEAAHVVPPIGAQGLNLGLRDAADIADIVRQAMEAGDDVGATKALRRYDVRRRPDVLSRTLVIDLANRSLLSDLLPVQSIRAAGMHLIGAFAPLRRLAMQEGLSPSWRPRRSGDHRATETPDGRSEATTSQS
jgi:2-octaprenyl-6-methoxyphenol hydroxylase